MTELTETTGFGSPIVEQKLAYSRHTGVLTTLALAICLVIAATAVSIGMAQVLPCAVGWHGLAAATTLLRS